MNDLFHRMRQEGIRKPRTYKKTRRMLHIYTIAVRPDKNDMAIEPEGTDRKQKGKAGMVKRRGWRKFCKWNRFWTSNSTSHTRPPPLLLAPSSPTSEKPLYPHPPSTQTFALFFFVLFSPTGQNHSFSSLIPLLHSPITLFLYGKSVYFNPFPPLHRSSHPRFIPSAAAAASPWQYKVPLD